MFLKSAVLVSAEDDGAAQVVYIATTRTTVELRVVVTDAAMHVSSTTVPQAQIVLETLYAAASKAQLDTDRPLTDVVVLIEGVSGATVRGILGAFTGCEVVFTSSGIDLVPDRDRDVPIETIVPSGSTPTFHKQTYEPNGAEPTISLYEHVVLGGTFDHLHSGHRVLLSVSCLLASKRVVCGVTDQAMLNNKKYKEYLETVDVRIANVIGFCTLFRPDLVYEVVPIVDAFGPSIVDPALSAIVVSAETLPGAHAVNKRREERALSQLQILVIAMLSGKVDPFTSQDDLALKISSTDIRAHLAALDSQKHR